MGRTLPIYKTVGKRPAGLSALKGFVLQCWLLCYLEQVTLIVWIDILLCQVSRHVTVSFSRFDKETLMFALCQELEACRCPVCKHAHMRARKHRRIQINLLGSSS